VTTGVRSGIDWIKLIRLLDLRLHRVVISPHYGDTTDDGTQLAGMNTNTKANQENLLARMEAKIDTNRDATRKERKAERKAFREEMTKANQEKVDAG
jgi:hypothetical protein